MNVLPAFSKWCNVRIVYRFGTSGNLELSHLLGKWKVSSDASQTYKTGKVQNVSVYEFSQLGYHHFVLIILRLLAI